jgi:uncharacterized protein
VRKVVYDCNIFAQALMNPIGPAGACVEAALDGRVLLYVSEFVLSEIRAIPSKPTPSKAGVTLRKAENLIQQLLVSAEYVPDVPVQYVHPIDEDDSGYINLALITEAELIVSRDRHLINLNNPAKPWSLEFRGRFPTLRVISPEVLLQELREDTSN